ncbi:MAG: 30S ribosomal protein S6 [Chloroflexota bacterium]
MRDYELTFIVRPDIPDDQVKAASERVQGLITQRGGELTHIQQWGKRRLAYIIDHQREGTYFVLRFHMDTQRAAELDHELNLDEQIVRFLMLMLDHVALEALKSPPPPMHIERRPRPQPVEAQAPPGAAPAPGVPAAATPGAPAVGAAPPAEAPAVAPVAQPAPEAPAAGPAAAPVAAAPTSPPAQPPPAPETATPAPVAEGSAAEGSAAEGSAAEGSAEGQPDRPEATTGAAG